MKILNGITKTRCANTILQPKSSWQVTGQDFRSIRSRFLYSALPHLNLSPQRKAQNFLNGLIIFRGMMEKTPDLFIHV